MKHSKQGFTLVEIAICLAIIGFAIVAIIGVLPMGMNTQRDNREETLINQDATVLLEAIRNGSRGADDLTNYVYAIVNTGTNLDTGNALAIGYTNALAADMGFRIVSYPAITTWLPLLTNGANIIGLMSTPEFANGSISIPSAMFGGISNHMVAYVRAMSGLAVDKPPQNNSIVVGDSFSYRVLCVNKNGNVDTNYFQPLWQPANYAAGNKVFYNLPTFNYWVATAPTSAADVPGQSANWAKAPFYAFESAASQHEVRLTFLWPQRANGSLGNGRQTFRAIVAGSIANVTSFGNVFYFLDAGLFHAN